MSRQVSSAVLHKARHLIELFNRKFHKAVDLDHADAMEVPMEAFHSRKVMKASYEHLKELHKYLERAISHMDHPRAGRDLEVLRDRHVIPAMEHIRKSHLRHHDEEIEGEGERGGGW